MDYSRFKIYCYPLLLLAGIVLGGSASPLALGQSPQVLETWLEDAELTDIHFVDAEQGWAVGEQGVILHTRNGGLTWESQESGVSCRLENICFINAEQGWVVGGYVKPLLCRSEGVLLHTRDGGATWHRIETSMLPALCRVKFFNAQQGWAVGESSAMYPQAIFRTSNGGRSWNSVGGASEVEWLDADFLSAESGIVVGKFGIASSVTRSRVEPSNRSTPDLPAASAVRFWRDGHALLAGEGGMLQVSSDQGETWQQVESLPLSDNAMPFDFSAIAVAGQNVWVAGSPGSAIFHSPDQGRNWECYPTGQTLPLNSLCFVDEKKGWGVGALGTILSTEDGGRSWEVQRRGGARAALLVVVSEPHQIPIEFLAKASAAEGYRTVVSLLHRRDIEQPPLYLASDQNRLHASLAMLGASLAPIEWRFPLRQQGLDVSNDLLLASWHREGAPSPAEREIEAIARQIRIWQPEVILTREPAADAPPSTKRVYEAMMTAVDRAAQPRRERLGQEGLLPPAWQVKRIAAALPYSQRQAIHIPSTAMLPPLATSVEALASAATLPLDPALAIRPENASYMILWEHDACPAAGGDLMGGLHLPPGGRARRREAPSRFVSLDHIRQQTEFLQQVKDWTTLAESSSANASQEDWLAMVQEQSAGLNSQTVGWALVRIANHLSLEGKPDVAAQAWEALLESHPQHPAIAAAWLHLFKYYGSYELARHQGDRAGVVDRYQRLLALASQIERGATPLYAEPHFRFSLLASQRQESAPEEALAFAHTLLATSSNRAWQSVARTEIWLDNGIGAPPKPLLKISPTAERPLLDGLLDDPCWEEGATASLQSPTGDDADWPAKVILAYDQEYLYIGAECRRAQPSNIEEGAEASLPRVRDGDLTRHDRIELLLDVDRDWGSYWILAFDERGWTTEQIGNDSSWNPQSFVASQKSSEIWTIEAAIPLEALSSPSERESPWAIGLQRIVPGIGFQSWTQPASIEPQPEGFGLIEFEP